MIESSARTAWSSSPFINYRHSSLSSTISLSHEENEYEPINPPEQPPSPSAQGRLSRRDQAEIETTQEQTPVEIQLHTELKPERVSDGVQASAAEPKLPPLDTQELSKQQELAGLLAASPIVFKPPPSLEKEDEIKSEEVLERKFIRIPDDNKAVIIPLHGDSDEEIHPERYKDPSLQGVQRIEGPVLEDLKPPPKPPRDIPSQSEYELVQSPSEMGIDDDRPHLSLQDRFKVGAGQMRDRIRKIQVPKINLPDRSQMKLPEKPQFLKERPQFLKEKPKFLTERPQFLKERPQFLKERPQFLKERPQFLKEKPKFLTERPKFLSERPKFHLPDRSNFKIPERFRMEKKSPKLDKPKIRRPNPSSLRRPLRDAITISSSSSHNLFETLKARTYPRFLSKKKRDRERAAQLRQQASFETESSQPSSPPDRRKLFPEKHRDIKFVDEESGYNDQRMDVQSEEGYEENTAPFHETYLSTPEQKKMESMRAKIDSSSDIAESDKEQISSGSGSNRHRAGVLEEIDSDEFFLRQKGLSREDVDVSRYLSKEIRDAFRSPKNALVQMDSTERYTDEYEDEEEEEDTRYPEETAPQPPERRSARSNRSFTGSRDSDFNTFPTRPTRRKQSEPEVGSRDIFEKVKKPPRKYRSRSGTRSSLRSLDRFSRRSATEDVPRPPSRQKSLRSLSRSRPESESDAGGGSALGDVAHEDGLAPIRPLRKSQSRGASVDERTSRGADSLPQDYGEYEQDGEEIEVDEEEIGDEELEDEQEQRAREHVHVFHAVPTTTTVPVRSESLDEEIPGYAVVRKPKPPRPPLPRKTRKEQLQSQLHTIKAHGITFFQTFPRRAMKSLNKPRLPVRPLKTPVRPPRRNRVFREPVYVDGDLPGEQPSSSTFKESSHLKHEYEEARDLQSGEIVERMKGRPLPAPPRPPRKTKDEESMSEVGEGDFNEPEDDSEEFVLRTRLNILGTPEGVVVEENILSEEPPRRIHSTADTSQQTSFELVETSVSIQTEPLPLGLAFENQSEALSRGIAVGEQASRNRLVEELMQRKENVRDEQSAEDTHSLFDPRIVRESEEAAREETPPPLPQRNIHPPPIPVIPPVQVSFPDKLHLTQLDVDKLNVNELQANTIKVSEIDGVTMQVTEIAGKSGNLVLNGVELPPDFIKNLVAQIPIPKPPEVPKPVEIPERVREKSPQPQLKRILTPPPPIVVQHLAQLASEAPSPPIQQASTTEQLPKPVTTRTRRKSPTRVIDDSEEELASVILERERKERERLDKDMLSKKDPDSQDKKKLDPPASPSISTEKPSTSQDVNISTADAANQQIPLEPSDDQPVSQASAFRLIKQLVTIWYRDLVSGSVSFIQGINSIFPENDKRRDAQMAALILVVMLASLIILGLGAEQSVHHHHWDYLNPPR
ncbi:unnamed protein product [Nesidiocoris tenuis]|uniref:Uncharacterized protein n=1 Tax=Nesidiocoris tenuis TaxID=355587 RepID=A0A6H5H830_9HEMI|nr:unnamed protein product [Nesidiocoris tenuis]